MTQLTHAADFCAPLRREGGATVSLVVTGSAKPLQQRQASAMQRTGSSAAAAASGQEQINILNLPLPDFDGSEKGERRAGIAVKEEGGF